MHLLVCFIYITTCPESESLPWSVLKLDSFRDETSPSILGGLHWGPCIWGCIRPSPPIPNPHQQQQGPRRLYEFSTSPVVTLFWIGDLSCNVVPVNRGRAAAWRGGDSLKVHPTSVNTKVVFTSTLLQIVFSRWIPQHISSLTVTRSVHLNDFLSIS